MLLANWTEKRSDWQDMLGEEKVELWVNFLNECSFQYCEAATRILENKCSAGMLSPGPLLFFGFKRCYHHTYDFGLNT